MPSLAFCYSNTSGMFPSWVLKFFAPSLNSLPQIFAWLIHFLEVSLKCHLPKGDLLCLPIKNVTCLPLHSDPLYPDLLFFISLIFFWCIIYIVSCFYFLVYLPLLEINSLKVRIFDDFAPTVLFSVSQCWSQTMYSINTCWINGWMIQNAFRPILQTSFTLKKFKNNFFNFALKHQRIDWKCSIIFFSFIIGRI